MAAAICLTAALLMARPARARLRLGPARAQTGGQETLTHPRRRVRAGAALVAGAAAVCASFGPAAMIGVGGVVAAALALRTVTPAQRRSPDVDVALCIDLLGAAMTCGALLRFMKWMMRGLNSALSSCRSLMIYW